MGSEKTFFTRWALPIVLAAVAAVPLLGYGVRGALQGGDNDVRQWLPEGFQETRNYDRFLELFGSEEMAVVSWPGATIDDDRLDRVAAGLRPYVGDPTATADPKPLFSRVITTREAIAELTGPPLNLSRDEAVRRLSGTLLGPDGKTAGLVVMVNDAGAADRHGALDLVYATAERTAGLSRDDLRLGGPTVDSVALDSESQRSRYLLASISVLVALGLAWRCLRQKRLVAMVFATALLCAGTSVAVVYFTGHTMNLMLVMMPTLVYVLGLSGAVHIANYYRDAAAEGPIGLAPVGAVKAAWLPVCLSAATTAVGLGSLGMSEVVPVKQFGLYSAVGVLVSVPILLAFLPALLHLCPIVPKGDAGHAAGDAERPSRLATFIIRRRRWITVGGLTLMAIMAQGVLKLETSVKLLNLFSPESRIIRDYTWLERHLGPLVPVEVVVRFDHGDRRSTLERMQVVAEVQRELDALEAVGGTMSAATFAPEMPSGDWQVLRRRILDRNLERSREKFAAAKYLTEDDGAELWRVSARVEALNSIDYGRFIGQVAGKVEPVLDRHAAEGGGAPEATYTGIVPLVYKAQRTLLNDLTTSFLTAFLIVGGMMMVMLRGVRAGAVAMIPNVFPAVLAFGAMGFSGMLCDVGSMMTAGVALGIAVDDTIHYLSWFRRGLDGGLSRRRSIDLAYRRCAGAMLQTTLICGLGLLVFSFSSFVPTARFSWLMATMLGTALIGDLLLLPALLAGPLGRYFERRPAPAPETVGEPAPNVGLAALEPA